MNITQAHVHMIGIGGIGMCGIAELLHHLGAQVSGSDAGENAHTQRLKDLGIQVFQGHDSAQIGDSDVVVYSSAIQNDNVEIVEARKKHIPLIGRAEALAELMRLKRGIAVAGTHGKTTTTSMLSSVFLNAQEDPTIVVGGKLSVIKSTAQLGRGEWMIAEADESDGSFSRLWPEIIVITNIDSDHLDYYKSFANVQKAFFDFASQIPFYGRLILNGDDPLIRELFQSYPKKIIYFGFNENNDVFLKRKNNGFEVFQDGQSLGEMKVPLPGDYNALNALASLVAAVAAGIPVGTALNGIEAFGGVDRRFQLKAEKNEIMHYDDYGHHPTEVMAVLKAFKEFYPQRRLVVLFQPHRYSRTQECWDDFVASFEFADQVYMLDIYPAGEKEIENINAPRMVKEIGDKALYVESKDFAVQKIREDLRPQDVFVTLGAGDVWRLGEKIYAE